MRWTVAEVENVIDSTDADDFTGNTQHDALCPSCVRVALFEADEGANWND
jgi:hypothetical protein